MKEQKWRSDPNEYNYMAFYYQRRHVANTICTAQNWHYSSILVEHKNNPKEIFNIANKLLFKNAALPLPPTNDIKGLANDFPNYFRDKILKIMDHLQALNKATDNTDGYIEVAYLTQQRINDFDMVTIEDIQQIITKSPPKACELDPVPTTLLWQRSDTVAPAIQSIVNKSLTMGKFPAVLKWAVLRPLLKKANLSLTLQNYCPVSNLSFLSKVIERCICPQLVSFSESSNNMEPLQSAYRTNHSTETALLKV